MIVARLWLGHLGRKENLVLVIIAAIMWLALFILLFSILSPFILTALPNTILSFLGSETSLATVLVIILSLAIVLCREKARNRDTIVNKMINYPLMYGIKTPK